MGETTTSAVFTYGTLLNERVLRAVINRVPRRAPAKLRGFTRHGIRGRSYPAVVANNSPSAVVNGKVLLDITPQELARLDRFEDDEYMRINELVTLEDETHTMISARVWARAKDNVEDLEGPWNYDDFVKNHLDLFLERCRVWAASDFED